MGEGADKSKKDASTGEPEGGLPEFIVTEGAEDAADTTAAAEETQAEASSDAGAELSAEEALAIAEAEAAAAEAAAKAAAAAAAAAAAKAKAEKVKAATSDTVEASAEGKGKKGKAKGGGDKAKDVAKAAATKAPEPEPEPILVIKPSAEGLFEGKVDEKAAESFIPDEPFRGGRSKVAIGAFAVVLLATVGGGAVIASNERLKTDVQCFLEQRLDECKGAEKRALEARWKDEDLKARNRYGDVTLVYFPPDAKVKVTKTTYTQEGLSGAPTKSGEEEIKNATSDLKPGQTIERLPLLNLPIFESEKNEQGDVTTVFTYEYKLEFEREGYEPRTFTYRIDDWQRVGPGNEIIDWKGLDLIPKPETLMANFAKAMGQLHCALKDNKKAKGLDPESLGLVEESAFEIIRLRNGFKTKDDFNTAYSILTGGQHAEWWAKTAEEIAKNKCDE